jgi:hypothetical protein
MPHKNSSQSTDPCDFDDLLDGMERLDKDMRARNTAAKPLRYVGDAHPREIVTPKDTTKHPHRGTYEWPDGSQHEVPRHCVQPDSQQLRRQLRLESWD